MSTTATIATQLAPALSSYAQRLHKNVRDDHHIVSPLGAWMLLALCARGSDGRLRDELTRALGMDVDLAATAVAELLEKPHAAVATGAGIWTSRELQANLAQWLAQLPVPVDRGEIPGKAALDAWAAKRTRGLIRQFPVQVPPESLLVLATALATKVAWVKPYQTVPARELNGREASEWSRQVKRVLKSSSDEGHTQFIARTERAGDVGVHTVMARENLTVTSVIAERDVSPADVIATAYDLAIATVCRRSIDARSLFDLPLGKSALWTISEEEINTWAASEREEVYSAVLPAWSSQATHDLGRADLGFPAAAAWLAQLTGSQDLYGYSAKQSVVARYNRKGFEAAAVSSMGLFGAGGGFPQEHGLLRRATLRFGHPFAVVAVAQAWVDWIGDHSGRTRGSEFWYGLPVYSAWVTVPVEAEEGDDEEMLDSDDERVEELMRAIRPRSPARPLADAPEQAPRAPWSRALDWIKGL
jgi:hypothetical protein